MLYNPNWDKPDLSNPSIPGLAYLLRHQELWPRGFKWNYRCVNHCAIGLATAQWEQLEKHGIYTTANRMDPEMRHHTIHELFCHPLDVRHGGWEATTPIIIADRLDRYVAGRTVVNTKASTFYQDILGLAFLGVMASFGVLFVQLVG
jgi:hypothetical protein